MMVLSYFFDIFLLAEVAFFKIGIYYTPEE